MIDEGIVDYVAIDIKNAPRKYAITMDARERLLIPIKKSVNLLMNSGIDHQEFRTTVVKEFHEARDFHEIGKWIKGAKAYYLQGFIDSGDTIKKGLNPVSALNVRICTNRKAIC